MIEDEELRLTFRIASEEHIQKLDEGLLQLEQDPQDKSGLAEMMREAHSLKGDANMLGVKDVGTLAHQLEHILGCLKRGEIQFNSELGDRFSQGLDAIRQLVNEAVTGISCGINTFYALAHLMGASAQPNSDIQPPTQLSSPPPEASPVETSVVRETLPAETSVSPQPPSPRYIEDEELRTTFKIACEEHLQKLDAGVLDLEQNPLDLTKIEALLREAHSIKGDAGMLGVIDVGTLAHQLENIFNSLKRGDLPLTPAICDCLSLGLSAITELVHEAVTGELRHLELPEILAQMGSVQEQTSPQSPPDELEVYYKEGNQTNLSPALPTANPTPVAPVTTLAPANSQKTASIETNGYRIETIRIETRNLDALMTQAGELTVTKIRIAHRGKDPSRHRHR